jgi:hypothetical protein
MTIELLDPNDTGEIPRPVGEEHTRIYTTNLPGEVTVRIDTGEKTKNLREERDAILAATGRMRHENVALKSLVTGHGYDPEAHSGPIFDLVDTATIHLPDDLAGPQKPPPPLPKPKADPAETGVNIFGGLGADLPEQPWPVPAPAVVRSRCRHKVKAAFWHGLWIGALGTLAVYSGLVLAALVVVR